MSSSWCVVCPGIAHVSCSANRMTVELDKASMPGIDMNWLRLKDSCSMTSNTTHIKATMSLTTCGTVLEVYIHRRVKVTLLHYRNTSLGHGHTEKKSTEQ